MVSRDSSQEREQIERVRFVVPYVGCRVPIQTYDMPLDYSVETYRWPFQSEIFQAEPNRLHDGQRAVPFTAAKARIRRTK